eukprot:1307623-Prymnesium_polylepis.2
MSRTSSASTRTTNVPANDCERAQRTPCARSVSACVDRRLSHVAGTLLMSGATQKHIIQRPWPEYTPESSAAVGRHWEGHTVSYLRQDRSPYEVALKKAPQRRARAESKDGSSRASSASSGGPP